MAAELKKLAHVKEVFPSDANFLLIKVENARKMYNYLSEHEIIVRDRSRVALCDGCLRITVGTPPENKVFIDALKNYQD
jgi:histidinol-phosphate aminotransferase